MRSILIIIFLAGTVSGQTAGTWRMNPEKSQHNDEEPLPPSLVIRFEPHAGGEVVTVWRTRRDGRAETDSYIQYYNGKDHAYPRMERFDSINARKLEDGTIAVMFKKGGKVVSRHARKLMPDGQQMTIAEQVLSETGQWLDSIFVFEKQKE